MDKTLRLLSVSLRPDIDRDALAVMVATLLNDPNVVRVKVNEINKIPRPSGRPRYIEV